LSLLAVEALPVGLGVQGGSERSRRCVPIAPGGRFLCVASQSVNRLPRPICNRCRSNNGPRTAGRSPSIGRRRRRGRSSECRTVVPDGPRASAAPRRHGRSSECRTVVPDGPRASTAPRRHGRPRSAGRLSRTVPEHRPPPAGTDGLGVPDGSDWLSPDWLSPDWSRAVPCRPRTIPKCQRSGRRSISGTHRARARARALGRIWVVVD
jgi:hypothetical protein